MSSLFPHNKPNPPFYHISLSVRPHISRPRVRRHHRYIDYRVVGPAGTDIHPRDAGGGEVAVTWRHRRWRHARHHSAAEDQKCAVSGSSRTEICDPPKSKSAARNRGACGWKSAETRWPRANRLSAVSFSSRKAGLTAVSWLMDPAM